METKGIDLTMCNNCRAWVRYKYDRVYEDTGRIEKVIEPGGEEWMRFEADGDGELVTMWGDGKICEHIMDFEIIPRAPETYKDWQVGDIVARNDKTKRTKEVIFRSGELVVCKNADGDIDGGYTCEQLHRLGFRLVLTDIERQIIEEKKVVEDIPKPHEFKKGDVVLVRDYGGFWKIKAFVKLHGEGYCRYVATTDGVDDCGYRECIPYNERTMHLLGTNDDYREE